MAFTKEEEKRLNDVHAQVQKNLNSRLDGFRFREVDAETFDEDAGKHDDKQISFVQRDENTIEMYMGDTQIGSSGSGGSRSAVMYADSTWGWEYRGSNEYSAEQTTYGSTKVNKIKSTADGQNAEDIFEIIPILSINPTRQIDGKYEVRYINGLWFKEETPTYGILKYADNDTPFTVKPWHHCAYDSVSVTCFVAPYNASTSNYTVTLNYTVKLGMVIPKSPVSLAGDTNSQNYPWRGMNPWYGNNSVHSFMCRPILQVREYWPYNNGFTLGRSRMHACASFDSFMSYKWHNFNTPENNSYMRRMNYTRTYQSDSQNANNSKEFGLCGLMVAFGPNDIDIEETVPHSSYTVKKFRPRILLLYENSNEYIVYNGNDNFSEYYRNVAKESYFNSVYEGPEQGDRLGLHNELSTGYGRTTVKMTGAFPSVSYYPTDRETQKWLETIYILQEGRKNDASRRSI